MLKYAIGVLPQWKVPMLKIELKVTFSKFRYSASLDYK
mgnify:FL=1